MIVAGFGFRRQASSASLSNALDKATQGTRADLFATAEDKSSDAAFADVAAMAGVPGVGVDVEALQATESVTQSAASLKARGTGSVAESAALAAAGPGARLLVRRVVSDDRMATCALAEGGTR